MNSKIKDRDDLEVKRKELPAEEAYAEELEERIEFTCDGCCACFFGGHGNSATLSQDGIVGGILRGHR